MHDPARHALAGIGNAAVHIAAAQAELGYEVSVCGFSDPLPGGRGCWRGVEIEAMHPWRWARLTPRLDASTLLPMLGRVVRRSPVDVLHLHELGLLHLPLSSARLVHLHIPLGTEMGASHLWKRADGVICASRYVREVFLAASAYPADRAFVVHNGALMSPRAQDEQLVTRTRRELGLRPSDVMVLFVGALVPMKGAHVLLEAIRDLVSNRPEYRDRIRTVVVGGAHLWRACGDPAIVEAYERQLRSIGSELNADFKGLVPHGEVERLYQACDIVVVPSVVQESHPLVICEAMAAGKPVIASRVGGIPETVVDGKTGILFPVEDRQALACAIRRLVGDRELRLRLGEAALRRARLFTWEAAAEKLDHIYRTILQSRGGT